MNANQMFIDELTNMTGITRERIVSAYKESDCKTLEEVRELFMDRFQLSFGYGNTLAEIILEEEGKRNR